MPAPNRRNKGETLAHHIETNVSKRALDDRDNLVATRTRHAKRWEEAAARLSPGSPLGQRADQTRPEYERAARLSRYIEAVQEGRTKPPTIVLRPASVRRYFLGPCLRCSREMWVHSPKPRVPICAPCRGKG